jgi:methionine synthase II (cobalamin-independent)
MDVLVAVVRAQEAAGLEPITDGGFGIGDDAETRWRTASALTDRPVKAVIAGPYSTGGSVASLRNEIVALVAAGCPLVEIHEPAAVDIGTDQVERASFRAAHQELLAGLTGVHLSLAITGGNADAAGIDTLLAGPYASLAVDLIDGPENWRLVVAAPRERGVICGALSANAGSDDRAEMLLWAAGYAASTGGRGPARVGLATASSLANVPWAVAMRKMQLLGESARLADQAPDQLRARLDPRAVDSRSAALGRVVPPPSRRRQDRPPDQA